MKFIGGDFANIEGRVLAWLAGEQWKLQAFRDYDAGTGADLYKLAYARSFGAALEEITKDQRQVGKVQELALGYQGGVGAFMSMAAIYGISIPDLAANVIAAAGDAWQPFVTELWQKKFSPLHYGQWKKELTRDQWAALKYVVWRWRTAHPETSAFWYDLQECAQSAVLQPGVQFITKTGFIQFKSTGQFLFCRLPSGRLLSYPECVIAKKRDDITGEWRDTLRYKTVVKNNWVWTWSYGGHLAENVTQATARDLLADAMHRLEAARYSVVMHVHDETLSEVPHDFGSVADYERILCASEAWAYGLPVAAEAWEGSRYQK